MNSKIIITAILFTGVFGAGTYIFTNSTDKMSTVTTVNSSPEQYIVLLDLSDRITQVGQINSDKQLITKIFAEFEKKVNAHLAMNSKDRFQICIAPQKNMPFDKEEISENLTLDLSTLKISDRVKKMKNFKETLSSKIDSLYSIAFCGTNSKYYQGSNIWQFFNETLPTMTSVKMNTRLIVITDGYFDFEENNPVLSNGNRSTTSHFLAQLRTSTDWKKEIDVEDFGILPVNQTFKNLSVCVAEIRSKSENNLNETEMLKYIWTKWIIENGTAETKSKTISHGSISNSSTQLADFLNTKY